MHLGRFSALAKRIAVVLAIGQQACPSLHAQTVSGPTPPERSSIDANGVDLMSGFVSLSEADLSIGDPANGGLAHTRSWLNQVPGGYLPSDGVLESAGWRHSFEITAVMDGSTNNMIISGGSYSRLFVGTRPGVYPATVDAAHMGATLTYSSNGSEWDKLVYTTRDGTIINFDNALLKNYASYTVPAGYLATKITKANGEIINFTYKRTSYNRTDSNGNTTTYYVVRLQSVSNNYGYMLKYGYNSNDPNSPDDWLKLKSVSAINLAATYCDPTADACTGSWPTVSYNITNLTDNAGKVYKAQVITLPSGRTRVYRFDDNYVRSPKITAIKDPASSNFSTVFGFVSYWPGTTVATVGSVIKNGVTYNYTNSTTQNSDGTYDYSISVDTGGTVRWSAVSNESQGILKTMTVGDVVNRYYYDSYNRVTSAQEAQVSRSFGYDDRGNVTYVSWPAGIQISAQYDTTCGNVKTCNKPNSVTDPLGNTTNFTYDSTHGGVLTVTSPAGLVGGVRPQTRTAYTQLSAYYFNSSGSIVAASSGVYKPTSTSTCITTASCAGTADEVKTTIAYGLSGVANNLLPTAMTTAAGNGSITSTTAVAYDAIGNKISEDGPLPGSGDTTTWTYNLDRQITLVVGPDPDGAGPLHNRAVKTSYNINGQVISVSTGTSNADGSGFTELNRADTSYDAYYRKVTETMTAAGAIQSRTDYSYDALARLSCTAVRMNPAVFSNSVDGCTLGTAGAFGPDRITHNVYDSSDRVQKVQTAYGTSSQRDEVTYTYVSGWGNLVTSVTDAKGNTTMYNYDFMRRRTKTYFPSPTSVGQSSTTDYEELTYDAASHVTNRRLRDGKQISYTFDNLGRTTLAHMVNPVDGNDHDIATSYDLLGRVTQVDDGAGKKVSYAYDALGRKLSEAPQLTGGATSYQYDAAGRRTRLTWSDGFYVTYDYDTLGELLAIRENGASSGPGVLASFAYDEQGKPTGLIRGNGVNDSYSYDAASRLAGLTITHPTAGNVYGFAYNPAGQLVSRSMSNDAYAFTQAVAVSHNYTVNGLNQYTASGSVVPTYDGRGNMTSAGSMTYLYDSKNQLTTFGSNSLGYDAMGRLATQATPATRFVYDGSDLIAETDASNAILRRYVHIPGSDNVLVWYEGAGTSDRRWLAHDERGSTTLITDGSGASLGINAYDEYGIPQSTNLGRFQYTGQTWLPELGMHYYKARMYSPSFGRFMQTDPIGYDDGPNWYNYVHGDPINGSDPTGNLSLTGILKSIWGAITGGGSSGNSSSSTTQSGSNGTGNGGNDGSGGDTNGSNGCGPGSPADCYGNVDVVGILGGNPNLDAPAVLPGPMPSDDALAGINSISSLQVSGWKKVCIAIGLACGRESPDGGAFGNGWFDPQDPTEMPVPPPPAPPTADANPKPKNPTGAGPKPGKPGAPGKTATKAALAVGAGALLRLACYATIVCGVAAAGNQ